MPELKPCPFCGAMPRSGVEFYEKCGADIKLSAVVECPSCHIKKREIFKACEGYVLVPMSDYNKAFTRVVEAWNRRVCEQE